MTTTKITNEQKKIFSYWNILYINECDELQLEISKDGREKSRWFGKKTTVDTYVHIPFDTDDEVCMKMVRERCRRNQ